MSFFKRLFGKKEASREPETQENPVQKNIIETKEVESPALETSEPVQQSKGYDIAEIKKQSTQVKNQDGFLAAVDFVKDFISTNDIEFKELIQLLKKTVPYMKKESSLSDSDISDYVHSELDSYPESQEVENLAVVADIFSRISIHHGIRFLEEQLGEFETDSQKTLAYFDSIILLGDFYLINKQSDRSFETISRATQLLTNFNDKFDHLWKHRIIADKSASVCFNGYSSPKYHDYLYFKIVSFFLEIASDVNSFPYLTDFFYHKKICFEDNWAFNDNPDFDAAIEHLELSIHKESILKDIYHYAFNELPFRMGMKEEYFHKDVLEPLNNLTEDYESNSVTWQKIQAFQDEFSRMPFDLSAVHNFPNDILSKYLKPTKKN